MPALALAKHYGAVLLTDVSADVAPVSGQAVSSKAVKAGLDYVRGFSSEFLGQVKDISTPSVEAISANLNNGIEVSLGDSDDICQEGTRSHQVAFAGRGRNVYQCALSGQLHI